MYVYILKKRIERERERTKKIDTNNNKKCCSNQSHDDD